jgi:hypothetical protein
MNSLSAFDLQNKSILIPGGPPRPVRTPIFTGRTMIVDGGRLTGFRMGIFRRLAD